MATKKTDVAKHVEAILGRKLGPGELERVTFVQPVATSTRSDGITTVQNLIIIDPNRCHASVLLDISGISTTGPDGKRTFRLTHFMCPPVERFVFPMNCVATPLSFTPCFVTVSHTLIDNGADVEIQAFTWDATGAPAPSVTFDWRCRVELEQIIK